MVCHCAWLFRRHRDGGRGISIFESPAGAVSADSSSTRLHICNERFRRLSTCSPHLVKAGAFDLPVRCELYELIRLVCNDVDCPLLHSHRRWMIRSYPWAMTFTANRVLNILMPSTHVGLPGFEAKLWLTSALAAFLPNIFLEWRAIFPRKTVGSATTGSGAA